MPDTTDAPRSAADRMILRRAGTEDIPTLLAIEERCFKTDRLTRRNFHHLLTRGNAVCLVAVCPVAESGTDGGTNKDGTRPGRIAGYALVLFNSGTSLARLYSFAVDPAFRGHGVGRRLLLAAEAEALNHESVYLRLEVRRDNDSAIALYQSAGYREFGIYEDYYEDHMEALRLEKRLTGGPAGGPEPQTVPYYAQTLDFTCGPSALMMAMRGLDPTLELSRKLELRLWRESTTIFMTSGHGGCGPHGLALAAWRRGFDVGLYVNDDGPPFLDSVRSSEKKEVMRLVHEDFMEQIATTDIQVHHRTLTMDELTSHVREGAMALVLISSFRIYHEKFPHWVAVTAVDDKFIYAHDPLVEQARHKTNIDRMNMPILRKDFERMARYGKAQLKATLVIRARREG